MWACTPFSGWCNCPSAEILLKDSSEVTYRDENVYEGVVLVCSFLQRIPSSHLSSCRRTPCTASPQCLEPACETSMTGSWRKWFWRDGALLHVLRALRAAFTATARVAATRKISLARVLVSPSNSGVLTKFHLPPSPSSLLDCKGSVRFSVCVCVYYSRKGESRVQEE